MDAEESFKVLNVPEWQPRSSSQSWQRFERDHAPIYTRQHTDTCHDQQGQPTAAPSSQQVQPTEALAVGSMALVGQAWKSSPRRNPDQVAEPPLPAVSHPDSKGEAKPALISWNHHLVLSVTTHDSWPPGSLERIATKSSFIFWLSWHRCWCSLCRLGNINPRDWWAHHWKLFSF